MQKSMMRMFLALHRTIYRLTGGVIGGKLGKMSVLLLTTKGRRSGRPWTTPIFYMKDGENFIVVASYNGAERHPSWWLNLSNDPHANVQARRMKGRYVAKEADAEERARYWPQLVAGYHQYEDYQRKTSRQFPIVILQPEPAIAP